MMQGVTITHITDEYTVCSGGVPMMIDALCQNTLRLGANVRIVADAREARDAPGGVELRPFNATQWGRVWCWGPDLSERLTSSLTSGGRAIAHVHGVWLAPQLLGARTGRRLNVPVVLTTHGMLSPYLWNYKGPLGKLKKAVYWRLMGGSVFREATVVHVITEFERRCVAEFLPGARFVTIPNSIDTDQIDDELSHLPRAEPNDDDRIILFVGRLDPTKGVDILIRAFARARIPSEYRLVIAGFERIPAYGVYLRRLVAEEGIAQRTEFVGPLHGRKKLEAYSRAWIVAFPSHSEVVGLVNLEAAACGTPTITTHQTGLSNWEEGGGILVQPDVDDVTHALSRAVSWSSEERSERGARARRLIMECYSWSVMRNAWRDLYLSLV